MEVVLIFLLVPGLASSWPSRSLFLGRCLQAAAGRFKIAEGVSARGCGSHQIADVHADSSRRFVTSPLLGWTLFRLP